MLFRLTTCNLYVAIQKGLFPIFFYLQQKISTQRRRVRNLCNRWVFFVNLAKLQCRCGKILFAMFAVQERKTTNFYTTPPCTQFVQPLVVFLSIWQNCNADAQKLSLRCLPCNREKPQNPPFRAFICVKSTHLTVNMV